LAFSRARRRRLARGGLPDSGRLVPWPGSEALIRRLVQAGLPDVVHTSDGRREPLSADHGRAPGTRGRQPWGTPSQTPPVAPAGV